MMTLILSSLIALILATPLAAAAESPMPSTTQGPDSQMQLQRKRHLVLPMPPLGTVARDTEQAVHDVQDSQRRDELIHEGRQPPLNRPDLDYSITNGIQGQNALRTLRGR